jgi:hypothetical protein
MLRHVPQPLHAAVFCRTSNGESSWLILSTELQLHIAGAMQHSHDQQRAGILEVKIT